MRDDIAILYNGLDRGSFLPIDNNISALYGVFLDSISRTHEPPKAGLRSTPLACP